MSDNFSVCALCGYAVNNCRCTQKTKKVNNYYEKFQVLQKIRQEHPKDEFPYKKMSLEELDAIINFSDAKEELFKWFCENNQIVYHQVKNG